MGVVVLFGLKRRVAPLLLVEIEPLIAPLGNVPLTPGGVEFTLRVRSSPVTSPVQPRWPQDRTIRQIHKP